MSSSPVTLKPPYMLRCKCTSNQPYHISYIYINTKTYTQTVKYILPWSTKYKITSISRSNTILFPIDFDYVTQVTLGRHKLLVSLYQIKNARNSIQCLEFLN